MAWRGPAPRTTHQTHERAITTDILSFCQRTVVHVGINALGRLGEVVCLPQNASVNTVEKRGEFFFSYENGFQTSSVPVSQFEDSILARL
jgi:hypothetical protein